MGSAQSDAPATKRIWNINPTGDSLTIEATGDFVEHGKSVEVPEDIALNLLKQDNWAASAPRHDKSEETK